MDILIPKGGFALADTPWRLLGWSGRHTRVCSDARAVDVIGGGQAALAKEFVKEYKHGDP